MGGALEADDPAHRDMCARRTDAQARCMRAGLEYTSPCELGAHYQRARPGGTPRCAGWWRGLVARATGLLREGRITLLLPCTPDLYPASLPLQVGGRAVLNRLQVDNAGTWLSRNAAAQQGRAHLKKPVHSAVVASSLGVSREQVHESRCCRSHARIPWDRCMLVSKSVMHAGDA